MKTQQVEQTNRGQVASEPATSDAIGPLREVLGQLRAVVSSLGHEAYTRNPVATVDGGVGGHVRHCLDHVQAMIDGARVGVIDYDHRKRGTSIETTPDEAAAEIDRLIAAIDKIPHDAFNREVTVMVMCTGDGAVTTCRSTLGRECVFVLSHTIHHAAMIAGFVRALGGELPEHFGLAPSTIAYRNR